jgi:Glycosyl hydrolases family 2, TIM barrel domain/Glycosyl hydrolases family 2
MIDRRLFLNALSASSLLAMAPEALASPVDHPPLISRARVSLNGEWECRVERTPYGTVTVPSSRRPSGFYTLTRRFLLPRIGRTDRVFLHFEGVTYWAQVSINGQKHGIIDPYVPHEFEFTKVAREGENDINVLIADLVPFPDGSAKAQIDFGIHPGFEAYGGIIRDVWAELRPSSFVENVRLAYELKNHYSTCTVRPRLMISSGEHIPASVEVTLFRNRVPVGKRSATTQLASGLTDVDFTFDIDDVALWSPKTPALYELTTRLRTEHTDDSWTCRTGFREIRAEGPDFLLNGDRLVLNGVCRHDMWKDQGFTLSRQQQEQDIRMIKALGCNFVRLVHYPHDRRVVELADELGLLVSEEPGFWQTSFQTVDRGEIELGYRILEATIRRDWNSPSVMIWFLSNECTLTAEFLKEGKRRCNLLDPVHRLVSAANDKPSAIVKPLFVAAGMDFFDQHEYTFELDEMDAEAKFDGPSKPLTFSEWGGKSVGQAQPIMGQSVDRLMRLVESGALSGHMFWSWQDVRQYSRIDGEMRNGVLESGVVTEAREPRKEVWAELSRLFEGQKTARQETPLDSEHVTLLPLQWIPFRPGNNFRPLHLQPLADSTIGRKAWTSLEAILAAHWANSTTDDQWKRSGMQLVFWQRPELEIAGVPFRSPLLGGRVRPLVLTPDCPELVIPIRQSCTQLHILGQVSFPLGYPLIGRAQEPVAIYRLQYANGKTQELQVRNGVEVAQSNCIYGASRIGPTATAAQPALQYVRDVAREEYQVLLWSIPVQSRELDSMQCQLNSSKPAIAIFAITLEQTPPWETL